MDYSEYRIRGKEMVDYIADYLENIRERRVFPDVQPGYMCDLVPPQAPEVGEPWNDVFADVERVIMPGVTHWQSPYMHAYFPALTSPASMLGDMLANAMGCLGFTWNMLKALPPRQASSPACTELEMIVMDWLGQMIGLPPEFLHCSKDSHGGGVIQTTASEATFVCLLAGRTEAISRYKKTCPDLDDAEINARLVAYCSDQAHSSVEKAGLIGLVKMRYIESDQQLSLRGDKLVEAIRRDRQKGLIPFFLCATLGSTGACAFDNLSELGPICRSEEIWMHVDAAYAGTAFICPEFRGWLRGVEYADSLAFNPSKWMMVHFDCTAMWVKNSQTLHRTFNVDPLYLQHENSGYAIDFMHWQIPLSKRFRALKLWFVLRSYGVQGLQAHIREGVRLASKFEALLQADRRFEVPVTRHLGLICFRLRGDNQLTERLLKRLNSSGKIHCVPASLKGKYVIRFTVTSTHTRLDDLTRDWDVIRDTASEILREDRQPVQPQHKKIMLAETRHHPGFGTSLLLANSPMSPKIVDGSYAAIFDNKDVLSDFAKKLAHFRTDLVRNSPALRRRVRGMLMSGKQFSLDSRIDIVSTMASNAPTDTENGPEAAAPNGDSGGEDSGGRHRRSASMAPVGPDDAAVAHLMVDDVIEEDDDESDEEERYQQRIRETVARNACRKCGHVIWVK